MGNKIKALGLGLVAHVGVLTRDFLFSPLLNDLLVVLAYQCSLRFRSQHHAYLQLSGYGFICESHKSVEHVKYSLCVTLLVFCLGSSSCGGVVGFQMAAPATF